MNKNGQSIVEYALIAILVILGIVFMGPYVLRSINAHFKLWDEGVHDSFEENLNQAPINAVPPIPTYCVCTPKVGNCGAADGSSSCRPNERLMDYDCNIEGCNGASQQSYCTSDPVPGLPSCCSQWVNEGCGTVPLGQLATSTNCPYGDQIQGRQCGSGSPIQCVPDPNCHQPICTEFTFAPNSITYCATGSSTAPTSGLTTDTAVTYVGNSSSACTLPYLCQVYCNPPYVVNQSNGINTGCIMCAPTLPRALISRPPGGLSFSCPASTYAQIQNPPAGGNYFFFNFYCHGPLHQTVNFSSVITPGQTYHLIMVSGRDKSNNHCSQQMINGVNQWLCDGNPNVRNGSDFIENDASILHIQVGDEAFDDQSRYTWEIVDSNYNEVFEWTGPVDYTMDIAFTPPCP